MFKCKAIKFTAEQIKICDKNEIEVVLRLSSNMIGDNETNFSHKFLLTNTQVSNLRKAFANNSSADIKLSKPNYPR